MSLAASSNVVSGLIVRNVRRIITARGRWKVLL
jgi:hypothetical protein